MVQKGSIKSQLAQVNEASGAAGSVVQQGAIKSQVVVLNEEQAWAGMGWGGKVSNGGLVWGRKSGN